MATGGRREKAKARASTARRKPPSVRRTAAGDLASDRRVAALVEVGLTSGEARAYVALRRRPTMSAAEVAAHAEMARPKVYEALRLLEERGFCRSMADESVTRFRAVSAGPALEGWLIHRDHERQLASDRDSKVVAELDELLGDEEPDGEMDRLDDYFESIVGRAKTGAALNHLIQTAQHSISHMTQPPFLQPRTRWNLAEVEARVRGIEIRTIYTPAALEDEERWRPLVDAGAELRVIDAIPMKLLMRDDSEAMVSLRDPETGEQANNSIIIRHPDLVRALRGLFEEQWEQAEALDPKKTPRKGRMRDE